MPKLSKCCGAKTYPLFIRRGLMSRAKDHDTKSGFRKAGYFCLKCGGIHIDAPHQRNMRHMVTVYNKRT